MTTQLLKRHAALCFALFSWCCSSWTAFAVTVDITRSPYNANTSMTDVGPIIQQAINDVRAQGGGTVYIPTGNWILLTPISIVNVANEIGSLVICGDGPHQIGYVGGTDLIYEKYNGTDAFTVSGSGGSNIPRVTIRDLAIDGVLPSNIYGYGNNRNGIVLQQANNFELSCVTVSGFLQSAIYINNSSYGSVRDADIGYCGGAGINCTSAKSLQLDNVAVHGCANAFVNPPQLLGCTVEGEDADGIVLQQANSTYVSLHDVYFERNNYSQTQEGADIFSDYSGSGSPTISLSMSGHCTWNSSSSSVAYRRLRGGFATVLKTDVAYWTETASPSGYWAPWDVTNTTYLDNGNPNAGSQEAWTTASGNSYLWRYLPQSMSLLP